jgi:hypothetical protein
LNRKIAISLFSLFLFLTWLFWGIYVSSGEEWLTVLYLRAYVKDGIAGSGPFVIQLKVVG